MHTTTGAKSWQESHIASFRRWAGFRIEPTHTSRNSDLRAHASFKSAKGHITPQAACQFALKFANFHIRKTCVRARVTCSAKTYTCTA